MSFFCLELHSWMQHSGWGLTRADQTGRITFTDLLVLLPLMHLRIQLPNNTYKSSLQAYSIHSPHSLYLRLGLPWPMCSTLHLALLNFTRFAKVNLSSLSSSCWMVSLPSSVFITQLGVISKPDKGQELCLCPCCQERCWTAPVQYQSPRNTTCYQSLLGLPIHFPHIKLLVKISWSKFNLSNLMPVQIWAHILRTTLTNIGREGASVTCTFY